jgi:class 3 adenylate cyclase/pimeloyl-ACP methyl ester carboxylesterase
MEPPVTRYAESGDVLVAYQELGEGDLDLVYCAEFWHSIEAQWMEPRFEAFLRRLGSFARLICFDQRGTGLSDPVPSSELPTLEQWMDDVRAVMDAAGSERAALLGSGGGGLMTMLFAATYPERTSALVLLNSFARLTRAPDYPLGTAPDYEQEFVEKMRTGWGRGIFADVVAPSVANEPGFREWWARYERLGTRVGAIVPIRHMLQQVDVRHVLPSVQAPTLILSRTGNRLVEVGHARYLAEHIPGATYVELPGEDHLPFTGDSDAILDEIEEFLTGFRHGGEPDRVLATVLFTDIVESTERAAALGDRRWRELLDRHDGAVRRVLARFRGREIDTIGDGFLATFDGPGRAVRAAQAIVDAVRDVGLQIRAGLHTGEVELAGADVRGIAVHIGARVSATAKPGEVLVSSTVKDLVAGSGIEFVDRGAHELKGVPGDWRLFSVVG